MLQSCRISFCLWIMTMSIQAASRVGLSPPRVGMPGRLGLSTRGVG
jgi:hypothetical protein